MCTETPHLLVITVSLTTLKQTSNFQTAKKGIQRQKSGQTPESRHRQERLPSTAAMLVRGLDRLDGTPQANMPDDIWSQHCTEVTREYEAQSEIASFTEFCARYADGIAHSRAMRIHHCSSPKSTLSMMLQMSCNDNFTLDDSADTVSVVYLGSEHDPSPSVGLVLTALGLKYVQPFLTEAGSSVLRSLGVRTDLDQTQAAKVAEATGFCILQPGEGSIARCQLILTEGRENTSQLAAALADITAQGAVIDLVNHEVSLQNI